MHADREAVQVINQPDNATPGAPADDEFAMNDALVEAGSSHSRLPEWFSLRLTAQVIWATLVTWWILDGAILSWLTLVFVGLVSALIFVRDPRPMTFVRIFGDWFGVTAWTIAWGISRAGVDTLGMPIQEQVWIDVDRILGFGELPSHRLQRLIDWDAPARLWEASLSLMYMSHFVVGFTLLAVMYIRDRVAWGQWWRRLVLMGTFGLVFFILIPSVPPWMASDNGTIAMVHEGLPRGWDAIKVEWIHNLYSFGRDWTNPIAAMPSLHAAYPALMFLYWGPRQGRFMKSVLAIYTLYMGFVIVITGQHWLIDVFAGWALAYFTHRLMLRLEAWNAARKARKAELRDVERAAAQPIEAAV